MNIFHKIDKENRKDNIPEFIAGDALRLQVKVKEGEKTRTQPFEGTVIRRQGTGARETFTVRKVSYGFGVERTFPLHSPKLADIEVIRRGDVRRAKLYYLRERMGKKAKVKKKARAPKPE
ncbi:MAG: 50S ribosomal protein L19 [Halarsenatibacteraceae bacterium]